MRSSSVLFSEVNIGGISVANRFMRSATWESLASEDGMPQQKLFDMMVDISKGKTGLVVPGYVYPVGHGKAIHNQTGMTTKKHADVWRETIKTMQKNGSKVVVQVCHGGDKCQQSIIGSQPIGCSGLVPGSREMTEAEICDTIDAFAIAAKNIYNAGANGVQLHCAHGYLLSQFLSPALNKRKDKWGGITENRARIVAEIVEAIRNAVKDNNFTVGLKINGSDFVEGGVDPQICLDNISFIPNLDFVEISGGIGPKSYGTRALINEDAYRKNSKKPEEIIANAHKMCDGVPYFEGYNLPAAQLVKEFFPEITVACVGGWRTFSKMEEAVKSGKIDIVSLSRPFLKQPRLVEALRNGANSVDSNSCSLCSFNRGAGITCQNWKK